MTSLVRVITQWLKLRVNAAKSAVAQPQQRKLLGFSFSDGPSAQDRECALPHRGNRHRPGWPRSSA
jgi:hypothetical protein